jgi:hypothetical protein
MMGAARQNVGASHCSCLHNATEQRVGTAWGVAGNITWTDPNLFGGGWSFHRVAVAQSSPYRFSETGWQKTTGGFRLLVAYNDGTGNKNVQFTGTPGANSQYSIQYDPGTDKHWYYVNGSPFYSVNPGFTWGNYVAGGGEVSNGIEGMGLTQLTNLLYLVRNANGTFSWASWGGHVNYVDNAPYFNSNGSDVNSFFDRGR